MLRIAIQAKGRLNEQSTSLLAEAGIQVAESKRKLISQAEGFPLEVLYLRDEASSRVGFGFSLGLSRKENTVTIELPEGALTALDIRTGVGDLSLEDVHLETLTIEMDIGDAALKPQLHGNGIFLQRLFNHGERILVLASVNELVDQIRILIGRDHFGGFIRINDDGLRGRRERHRRG